MSTGVPVLPLPLLLLVHLHILQYPKVNDAELDINLFDARRGLRDRTKTMEDICYFLVERLERSKNAARKILPSYPCVKPAESTAFRTSLAKYLEVLRHSSMPNAKTGSKSGVSKSASYAWWWKDVVVRKSLLEECSGEKFQRLMLALSTHVLLNASKPVNVDVVEATLQAQPGIYATRLLSFQSHKSEWVRSASSLLQRENQLRLLRSSLLSTDSISKSKFTSLSTERLLALTTSKLRDVRHHWRGRDGERALIFLLDLSGLASRDVTSSSVLDRIENSRDHHHQSKGSSAITPLLPVAAAHHPSHLRRLRKPVFAQNAQKSHEVSGTTSSVTTSRSHAQSVLAGRAQKERQMSITLQDALARVDMRQQALLERTKVVEGRMKRQIRKTQTAEVGLDLWEDKENVKVNFDRHPSLDEVRSMSLLVPCFDDLDERIHGTRQLLAQRSNMKHNTTRLPKPTMKNADSSTQRGQQTRTGKTVRSTFAKAGGKSSFETGDASLLITTPRATKSKLRNNRGIPGVLRPLPSLLSPSISLRGAALVIGDEDSDEW